MEKKFNDAGNVNVEGIKEKARHIDQMVQDASNSGMIYKENTSSARRRSHQPPRAQAGHGISWNQNQTDELFNRSVKISRGEYIEPTPVSVEDSVKTVPVQSPSESPRVPETAVKEEVLVSTPKVSEIPDGKQPEIQPEIKKTVAEPVIKTIDSEPVQAAEQTCSEAPAAMNAREHWRSLIEQHKPVSAVNAPSQKECATADQTQKQPAVQTDKKESVLHSQEQTNLLKDLSRLVVQSEEKATASQKQNRSGLQKRDQSAAKQKESVAKTIEKSAPQQAEPVKKTRKPIHLEPVTINWAKWTPSGGLVDKEAERQATLEAERRAAEERAEAERKAAEERAEAERIAAEERAALEAAQKAEQERLALEEAKAEARAEAERIAAEERAALEAAQKAEQERLALEKDEDDACAKTERIAAEETAEEEIFETETQPEAAPQKIEWAPVHTRDIVQGRQKTEGMLPDQAAAEVFEDRTQPSESDRPETILIEEEIPAAEPEVIEPLIPEMMTEATDTPVNEQIEERIEISKVSEDEDLPEENADVQQPERTAEEENRKIFDFLKGMIQKSEETDQPHTIPVEEAKKDDLTFEAEKPVPVENLSEEDDWLISDEEADTFFEETTEPDLPDHFFEETTEPELPDHFFEETTVAELPDHFFEEVTIPNQPNVLIDQTDDFNQASNLPKETTAPFIAKDNYNDFFVEGELLPDDDFRELSDSNDPFFKITEQPAAVPNPEKEIFLEDTVQTDANAAPENDALIVDENTDAFWEEIETSTEIADQTGTNLFDTEVIAGSSSGSSAMDEFFRISNKENVPSPFFNDATKATYQEDGPEDNFFLEECPPVFDTKEAEHPFQAETEQPVFKEEVNVYSEIETLTVTNDDSAALENLPVEKDDLFFDEVVLPEQELIVEEESLPYDSAGSENLPVENDDFFFEEVSITEAEPVFEESSVTDESIFETENVPEDDFVFEEIDLPEQTLTIEEEIVPENDAVPEETVPDAAETDTAFATETLPENDAFFEEVDLPEQEPIFEEDPLPQNDAVSEDLSGTNDDLFFEEVSITDSEPVVEESSVTDETIFETENVPEDDFVFEEIDLPEQTLIIEEENVPENDVLSEETAPDAADVFFFEEVTLTETEPIFEEAIAETNVAVETEDQSMPETSGDAGDLPADDFAFEEIDLPEAGAFFEEVSKVPVESDQNEKMAVSKPIFAGQKKPVFGGATVLKPASVPQKDLKEESLPETLSWEETDKNTANAAVEPDESFTLSSSPAAMDAFFRISDQETELASALSHLSETVLREEAAEKLAEQDEINSELFFEDEEIAENTPVPEQDVTFEEEKTIDEPVFAFEEENIAESEPADEEQPISESNESFETADIPEPEATVKAENLPGADIAFEEAILPKSDLTFEEVIIPEPEPACDAVTVPEEDTVFEEVTVSEPEFTFDEEVITESEPASEEEKIDLPEFIIEEVTLPEADVTFEEEKTITEPVFAFEEENIAESEPADEEQPISESNESFETTDIPESEATFEAENLPEADIAFEEAILPESELTFEEVIIPEPEPACDAVTVPEDDAVFEEVTISEPEFTFDEEVITESEPASEEEKIDLPEFIFEEVTLPEADVTFEEEKTITEPVFAFEEEDIAESEPTAEEQPISASDICFETADIPESEVTFEAENLPETDANFDEAMLSKSEPTVEESTAPESEFIFEEVTIVEPSHPDHDVVPIISPDKRELFFEEVPETENLRAKDIPTGDDFFFGFEEDIVSDTPKTNALTFDFEEETVSDAPKSKPFTFDFEEEIIPEPTDKKDQKTAEPLLFEEEIL